MANALKIGTDANDNLVFLASDLTGPTDVFGYGGNDYIEGHGPNLYLVSGSAGRDTVYLVGAVNATAAGGEGAFDDIIDGGRIQLGGDGTSASSGNDEFIMRAETTTTYTGNGYNIVTIDGPAQVGERQIAAGNFAGDLGGTIVRIPGASMANFHVDTFATQANPDAISLVTSSDGAFKITGQGVRAYVFDDGIKFTGLGEHAGNEVLELTYAVYKAAFNRVPDLAGYYYWVKQGMGVGTDQAGLTIKQVAANFVESAEFKSQYNGLDDHQLVGALYHNVLGRDGEAAGVSFWESQLAHGASKADLLVSFSESNENMESVHALFSHESTMNLV